ncbi:hypothetical protein FJY71_07485 [candidate division WOR-3 bacterium]|nr:hypothetical protein [candidate division WOR-3 bacterium]
MKALLSITATVALLAGCGTPCCRKAGAADVSSAPESVMVDGRTFRLQADLWRDFQPIAPPDGQPLMAAVRVVADDNMPLPDDLAVDAVWVLNGGERWSPPLSERPERLAVHLADGPKWGPGISVDVVVRLARGSEAWLLRAPDVPIKRTD